MARDQQRRSRTSIREGGTLIEYEDEDPQFRVDFEAAIKKLGVPLRCRSSITRVFKRHAICITDDTMDC